MRSLFLGLVIALIMTGCKKPARSTTKAVVTADRAHAVSLLPM